MITLTGNLGVRKRREVEKQIHSGHFQVLLATGQLLGEGTDFPSLDCLFLVYPFSFEGKLTQYIDRIEQGELSEKGRYIFDYRDSKTPFLERMSQKRNRYYKEVESFDLLQD